MTTDRDIRDQVLETLGDWAGSYDVDGIVGELMTTYDLTGDAPTMTVDAVDDDHYWATVGRHERWTADQAGAHCTTEQSPDGVPGKTYRQYVKISGAPDAVDRDLNTGAKLYDADAVRLWHAGRPGQGARTDLKEAR